jgi:hypothetical protein
MRRAPARRPAVVRVTHFWSTDHGLSTVFAPLLASGKVAPNTCFVFAPGRFWTAAAPVPDRVLQSPRIGAQPVPSAGQKFNGNDLAADVQQLLLQARAGRSR